MCLKGKKSYTEIYCSPVIAANKMMVDFLQFTKRQRVKPFALSCVPSPIIGIHLLSSAYKEVSLIAEN